MHVNQGSPIGTVKSTTARASLTLQVICNPIGSSASAWTLVSMSFPDVRRLPRAGSSTSLISCYSHGLTTSVQPTLAATSASLLCNQLWLNSVSCITRFYIRSAQMEQCRRKSTRDPLWSADKPQLYPVSQCSPPNIDFNVPLAPLGNERPIVAR
jgi:hypothetical protein